MKIENSLEDIVKFANKLADESAKITMSYFRKNIKIENKRASVETLSDKKIIS